MNIKFTTISLAIAALLAYPTLVMAQAKPADSAAKPMVIDAAVVDNRYQLY
jgi:hypothetical protein